MSLSRFKFMDVDICVWIPYRRSILKDGMNHGFITHGLYACEEDIVLSYDTENHLLVQLSGVDPGMPKGRCTVNNIHVI